ncbi:MAG TPA: aminotransferase class I/II-fold pyridoxal phosphate-dependent enzyme [Solirubrobacterales bacterium]|nr:aminotransferase class I/II-fold pyridoxal phosphate-dependent enzyme [Solirubrobacterales bacterium]
MDQTSAPYLDALVDFAATDPGRFHIPGHKGGAGADPGLRSAIGDVALRLDIPSGIEGIDVGRDPLKIPFQQAQRLAAEAWGARRSWFLVNGASGGNHAICMALAHLGEDAVVQRNVHSSVIDGLVLSGLRPRFVAPEIDDELGVAHCMTPAALEQALAEQRDAVAAFIVSPTYFGAVADVAGIAAVAHEHDVPLVVDESWGAHLAFSELLPANALACGADVVLNSVHKLAGSMTQSAILHVGAAAEHPRGRIDETIVDRSVTLVESTSPNALLSASLDAARRHNATLGEALLAETIGSLRELRREVREIPGLDVLGEEITKSDSVHAWDPLRVSIDVRGTGVTGNRVARFLRERHDIWFELYAENVVVAIFGIGENVAETGARLLSGLRDAATELHDDPGEERAPFAPPPPWGPTEMTPRQAFLGPQETVPFDAAEGRIAAESLAAYPPGVPNVLPGERLSRATLDFIADSLAHGGQVRGASDRSLATIRVVIE